MQVRPIVELLKILLDNIDKLDNYGLCSIAGTLSYRLHIINSEEHNILYKYIQNNRPSIYSSFSAFRMRNLLYFWPEGQKRNRIKWLKKHIKLNS